MAGGKPVATPGISRVHFVSFSVERQRRAGAGELPPSSFRV
jgi:hypothetical protein